MLAGTGRQGTIVARAGCHYGIGMPRDGGSFHLDPCPLLCPGRLILTYGACSRSRIHSIMLNLLNCSKLLLPFHSKQVRFLEQPQHRKELVEPSYPQCSDDAVYPRVHSLTRAGQSPRHGRTYHTSGLSGQ